MNKLINKPIQKYSVVVFGGGIVGMSLALSLNNKGMKVALISNQTLRKTSRKSALGCNLKRNQLKVSALSKHSLQFLAELGLAKEISQFAQYYQKMQVIDCEKQVKINLNNFDFESNYLIQGKFLGAVIANCFVEQKLEQLVFASSVDYFDTSSNQIDSDESIEIRESGVEIELASVRIGADLLVGSDGNNSLIRKISGLGYREKDYKQMALVAYIQTQNPIQDLAWQRFMSDKTIALLPCSKTFNKKQTKPHFSYSIVWTMDKNQFSEVSKKNDDEICKQITQMCESKFGEVTQISKRTYFPLVRRQAKNYAGKSVFLVGDAAHSIHPLAGMGLNLGLLDAHLLAHHLKKIQTSQQKIGEYQNLNSLAKKRYLDNEFAQELMDSLSSFYRLNINSSIARALNPMMQKDWIGLSPRWLKNTIIRYIQGYR